MGKRSERYTSPRAAAATAHSEAVVTGQPASQVLPIPIFAAYTAGGGGGGDGGGERKLHTLWWSAVPVVELACEVKNCEVSFHGVFM